MCDKIQGAYKQSKSIYDDVLTQNKWWSRLYIRLFWGVDDLAIAEKMACARITCLDYSEDMLAAARARIVQQGLIQASTLQGDVGQLPFADGAFDAVCSSDAFLSRGRTRGAILS